MNWLEYDGDTGEISQTNGIASLVVGYAKTGEEAEQIAQEKGMRIAIPDWTYQDK